MRAKTPRWPCVPPPRLRSKGVGLRGFGLFALRAMRVPTGQYRIRAQQNLSGQFSVRYRQAIFYFWKARAGNSVANKRQVLHTKGKDFPCNKKTAGSKNVGD